MNDDFADPCELTPSDLIELALAAGVDQIWVDHRKCVKVRLGAVTGTIGRGLIDQYGWSKILATARKRLIDCARLGLSGW